MSSSLLHPPGNLGPQTALKLSQRAPAILSASSDPDPPRAGSGSGGVSSSSFSPGKLLSTMLSSESAEQWVTYENLMLSCLRTGDELSAHRCLERLVARFGNDNERIMALKGLVKEVAAADDKALAAVLRDYDGILVENDANIPIRKRRIAVLRSLNRAADAASALRDLLDFTPTDAEAWAELADVYLGQGLYAQAIFAQEEVLILMPNAWNIHARLGEIHYMAATASGTGGGEDTYESHMAESVKRFCRSIELCDDYLRGYYGLKTSTAKLLSEPPKSVKKVDPDTLSLPDTATLQKLNELATQKLAEIVRRSSKGEKNWTGYDAGEIEAARELLSKDESETVR